MSRLSITPVCNGFIPVLDATVLTITKKPLDEVLVHFDGSSASML
jgi:hypothetical protein